MKRYPTLSRWLAAAASMAVLGLAVLLSGLARSRTNEEQRASQRERDVPVVKSSPRDWPMYGGDNSRNLVNIHVKGLPGKWEVGDKTNIKWSADLGSKSYGGPVVAGGKVYVGTNNQKPRDPKLRDKG